MARTAVENPGDACPMQRSHQNRRKLRELFEENGDPRPRHLLEKNCIHVRAPSRISAPRQSRSCRQDKIPSFRCVNRSAEPCAKTRPAFTGPARDGCEIRRSGWKNARGAGRTKEWPQREQENWHFQTAGFKRISACC